MERVVRVSSAKEVMHVSNHTKRMNEKGFGGVMVSMLAFGGVMVSMLAFGGVMVSMLAFGGVMVSMVV